MKQLVILFSRLKEIYFGVYFFFFVDVDVEITAFVRQEICDDCTFNSTVMKKLDKDFKPWRRDEHCLECKCNLAFKTRSLKSNCPNKKW